MSNFVHLHVHSHYSLLDGLSKVGELVERTKQLEMPALALTDHGALYGAIEFYKTCREYEIKPIIGLEAYMTPRALHFKQPKKDDKATHLTLLARNEVGYKNLITLTTIAHLDGFYYKPRIDKQLLFKHAEGIICLSGCMSGELRRVLSEGDDEQAKQIVQAYKEVFGDDYYLEIQRLETSDAQMSKRQKEDGLQIIKLSKETGIPMVATHDAHYLEPGDAAAQDILLCTRLGQTVDDPKRFTMSESDLSLLPPRIMRERFEDIPEACDNTLEIAAKVELELDLKTWHFPDYQLPLGKKYKHILEEQVQVGVERRFSKINKEIQERLSYELDVINHKRYTSYFLIVAEFMAWARSQGILTTSRGSASGSLVSYCLGITNIDPIKYQLPFERFLTKERPSPPDIDVDIADDRRDEIIEHVRDRYGKDKVAQVCTFGKMLPRAAVRDVTRALGYPYATGDRIAKMIPFGMQGFPVTIADAKKRNPELKTAYSREPDVKRILDLAQKIEGCARHVSVHAAGVVITPTKLTDYVPLQLEPKGRHIITQYDMYAIDPNVSKDCIGLLKMDFLGLRNLSILGHCVEIVKATKNIDIDVYNIPLDDKKTFAMLSRGKTFGVFQMSGSGMTAYLKELEPTKIEHLMAMVALYRPGPMEIIPEYIERKRKPETITYPDLRLKEILQVSYGLLIYQDDILMTAIHLAGYPPAEADTLRKAMGKKIPSVMAAERVKFIKGCVKNGLTETKAEEIWNYIEPFAGYGFNKAHAASYGMLGYQTAYMKANYSAEYMAALMTCESHNTDKIAAAVTECPSLGITVLPPDVNKSLGVFTYISDTQIRFGLGAIKNLGSDVIRCIVRERKERGRFKSIENLLKRVRSRNLNRKSLEALIKAGALDSLGERNQLTQNLDLLSRLARSFQSNTDTKQQSLFAGMETSTQSIRLEPASTASPMQRARWEREFMGLYVTEHPTANLKAAVGKRVTQISDITEKIASGDLIIVGVVCRVKKIMTKKSNEPMVFAELEDQSGRIETVVFPSILAKQPALWKEEALLAVRGRVSDKEGELKLIAQAARLIDESSAKQTTEKLGKPQITNDYRGKSKKASSSARVNSASSKVLIAVPGRSDAALTRELMDVLANSPGPAPVLIEVAENGDLKRITTRYKIDINQATRERIEAVTGTGSVSVI